jgi:hypothetical protein
MDDLERLLMAHRMQQQQGGMMQRPPMGGMQPPDSAVSGVGPVPEMQAPFGSQVKDYLAAGSGALGGAGMAAGLGRGVARPLAQGLGGQALGAYGRNNAPDLNQLLQMAAMGRPGGSNMPMSGPGMAGPAGDAMQRTPANQGALVDLIAALMRKRGQGISFPPQTSGSQFGMGQGVLTQ